MQIDHNLIPLLIQILEYNISEKNSQQEIIERKIDYENK